MPTARAHVFCITVAEETGHACEKGALYSLVLQIIDSGFGAARIVNIPVYWVAQVCEFDGIYDIFRIIHATSFEVSSEITALLDDTVNPSDVISYRSSIDGRATIISLLSRPYSPTSKGTDARLYVGLLSRGRDSWILSFGG